VNVAFLLFNRPDVTRETFSRIRAARPERLFLIADGPRSHVETDAARCTEARAAVETIDWPCQIERIYSDVNLGCGRRVSSGLSEVFQAVDRAIIVEDDCLVEPTFFEFCRQLLDRYADDERIMSINGQNFGWPEYDDARSYAFSKYFYPWGWATWSRAWRLYDFHMTEWPTYRDAGMLAAQCTDEERDYWIEMFNRTYDRVIDTWDYQYLLTCWLHHGLSIVPRVNLVANIGFDADATHTTDPSSRCNTMQTASIESICHPNEVCRDAKLDKLIYDLAHYGVERRAKALELAALERRLPRRLKKLVKRVLGPDLSRALGQVARRATANGG
jgi:hypothetical protein